MIFSWNLTIISIQPPDLLSSLPGWKSPIDEWWSPHPIKSPWDVPAKHAKFPIQFPSFSQQKCIAFQRPQNFPSCSHHSHYPLAIKLDNPPLRSTILPLKWWQKDPIHSGFHWISQPSLTTAGFIKAMNSHLRLPFLPTFSPSRAICSMRWRVEPCQARFQVRCKGTCWPSDLNLTLGIKNDETSEEI